MADPHNILRFNDVTIHHGRHLALDGITTSSVCGSSTAIMGPNGAGKSTLLRAILGWHRLSRGDIRIGDHHTFHQLPRLAYLPQRQTVDWDFPVNVLDVVRQGRYPGLRFFQRFAKRDVDAVARAMQELDIENLADRPISRLSGGQQQRVFLARALAQGADIFLLDEPFSGLDVHATEELLHILRAWQAQGRTVLCAVHDLELARKNFVNGVLLRTQLIASGPIKEVLTDGNIERAFGGSCVHNDNPLAPFRTAQFPS